jgi:hypothetical protein
MATFVEVQSIEKNCPVIVNLDHVVEIAPMTDGTSVLFMNDGSGANAKYIIRVKDSYDQFKQFAMQTVTSEDIARRFPKATKETKKSVNDDLVIPKL